MKSLTAFPWASYQWRSSGASKNTQKTTGLKMRDSECKDKWESREALNVFYVILEGKGGSGTWLHGVSSVLGTRDQSESFRSEGLPWPLGIQTFSNWMGPFNPHLYWLIIPGFIVSHLLLSSHLYLLNYFKVPAKLWWVEAQSTPVDELEIILGFIQRMREPTYCKSPEINLAERRLGWTLWFCGHHLWLSSPVHPSGTDWTLA